jgi:hypothetical protein
MYKIIGADGKEYGPVTVEQLRDWLAQGRFNGRTKIQAAGSAEWITAAQVPELAALFVPPSLPPASPSAPPPVLTPLKPHEIRSGLAILSFVLGICSFVLCLSFITGIPAIICGHVARGRARRYPQQFGGAGFAMAGLVLGYVSIIFSLVIAAFLMPVLSRARRNAQWEPQNQRLSCENNLRQVGLAFKVWALDHNDRFPFNVSTNSGGTLELCQPDADGYDQNALAHFRSISNELNNPGFLVCPKDRAKHAAPGFEALQTQNLSYRLRTGPKINGDNPQEVLAVCPVDGNQLFCDGNVRKASKP